MMLFALSYFYTGCHKSEKEEIRLLMNSAIIYSYNSATRSNILAKINSLRILL